MRALQLMKALEKRIKELCDEIKNFLNSLIIKFGLNSTTLKNLLKFMCE